MNTMNDDKKIAALIKALRDLYDYYGDGERELHPQVWEPVEEILKLEE